MHHRRIVSAQFLKFTCWIGWFLISLAGCVDPSQPPGSSSESLGSFLINHIEPQSSVYGVEKDGLGAPNEIIYNFKACVTEQARLEKVVDHKFRIWDLQDGQEITESRTDSEGCLTWSEKVAFNFWVAKPIYVPLPRRFQAMGVQQGNRDYTILINPWAKSRDTSYPEAIDSRFGTQLPTVSQDQAPLALNGDWQYRNIAFKPYFTIEDTTAHLKENHIGGKVDNMGIKTILSLSKIEPRIEVMNMTGSTLSFPLHGGKVWIEPFVVGLVKKEEGFQKSILNLENTFGKFDIENKKNTKDNSIPVGVSEKEKQLKKQKIEGQKEKDPNVKKSDIYRRQFSADMDLTLPVRPNTGRIELAFRFTLRGAPYFVRSEKDTLCRLGSASQLFGSCTPADLASLARKIKEEKLAKSNNNQKQPYTAEHDAVLAESFDIDDYLDKKTTLTPKQLIAGLRQEGKKTISNIYAYKDHIPLKYMITDVQLNFLKIEDGTDKNPTQVNEKNPVPSGTLTSQSEIEYRQPEKETPARRWVRYRVQACLSHPIRRGDRPMAKSVQIQVNNGTVITVDTGADGCFRFIDYLAHKYYGKQGYFRRLLRVSQPDLKLDENVLLMINPWDYGFTFGGDARWMNTCENQAIFNRLVTQSETMNDVPLIQDRKLTRHCLSEDPDTTTYPDETLYPNEDQSVLPYMRIQNFNFNLRGMEYYVDADLDLKIKRTYRFWIQPYVIRPDSIIRGVQHREMLRPGKYLIKLAIRRNPNELASESDAAAWKANQRDADSRNEVATTFERFTTDNWEYLTHDEKVVHIEQGYGSMDVEFTFDDLYLLGSRNEILFQIYLLDGQKIKQQTGRDMAFIEPQMLNDKFAKDFEFLIDENSGLTPPTTFLGFFLPLEYNSGRILEPIDGPYDQNPHQSASYYVDIGREKQRQGEHIVASPETYETLVSQANTRFETALDRYVKDNNLAKIMLSDQGHPVKKEDPDWEIRKEDKIDSDFEDRKARQLDLIEEEDNDGSLTVNPTQKSKSFYRPLIEKLNSIRIPIYFTSIASRPLFHIGNYTIMHHNHLRGALKRNQNEEYQKIKALNEVKFTEQVLDRLLSDLNILSQKHSEAEEYYLYLEAFRRKMCYYWLSEYANDFLSQVVGKKSIMSEPYLSRHVVEMEEMPVVVDGPVAQGKVSKTADERDICQSPNEELRFLFPIERKIHSYSVKPIVHDLGGGSMNYGLQQGYRLGRSASGASSSAKSQSLSSNFKINLGVGLSASVGSGSSGSTTQTFSIRKDENLASGSNHGANLVIQRINTLVTIRQGRLCMTVRPTREFFQRVVYPTAPPFAGKRETEIEWNFEDEDDFLKYTTSGLHICRPKIEELNWQVPEVYHYVFQHFISHYAIDMSRTTNRPWKIEMRGARPYFHFTSMAETVSEFMGPDQAVDEDAWKMMKRAYKDVLTTSHSGVYSFPDAEYYESYLRSTGMAPDQIQSYSKLKQQMEDTSCSNVMFEFTGLSLLESLKLKSKMKQGNFDIGLQPSIEPLNLQCVPNPRPVTDYLQLPKYGSAVE